MSQLPPNPLLEAWPRCLAQLEREFPSEDIHTWLRPLQADARERRLVLFAPNAFVVEQVRERFLPRIRELLDHYAGIRDVAVEVGALRRAAPASAHAASMAPSARAAEPAFHGNLDNQYVFENFVEGRSNQLARAAAWQASQSPGERTHNPLLLYGASGLGKTHLMVAAGNELLARSPGAKVLYLRAREFMDGFTKALYDPAAGGTDAFRKQFQGLDALLIDDIQFFAGKDRTQEEFFHTFNALFDGKQQIILTCDRFPREVDGLEDRLKSRLSHGLAVAIDPPDYETRAQIVLSKARDRGVPIPDDVANLIAKKMRSTVRDLEGALNTLIAGANFTGRPITLEFAQETLRDVLRNHSVGINQIQKTVADYYGLQVKDLIGSKRTRSLARPRQIAMSLAKELTGHSLPEIGDAFGGRDHTTVLHARRQISTLLATDGKLHEDWEKLLRKLSE